MRKVETVEQMPEEYRQVILKLLAAIASTEFASVEQHHPWINKGPTAEDRYIQAQIAADEAHQGFIDCRLLRSFGEDGVAVADDLLRRRMASIRSPRSTCRSRAGSTRSRSASRWTWSPGTTCARWRTRASLR